MSTGSLIAFLGIALVDCINPSAIVVTLQLLSRRAPIGAVLLYIAAVFVTYTTVTILLVLGLGLVIEPLTALLETRPASIVLAVLGAAMLGYAVFSKNPKEAPEKPPLKLSSGAASGLVLLGVSVTILELPTALPLFGAVGLLTSANLPLGAWLTMVLVYNLIFVMPPVLLAFGYRWLGERGGAKLEKRLSRGARESMLWIVGILGFYTLMYALSALGVLGDSVSIELGQPNPSMGE